MAEMAEGLIRLGELEQLQNVNLFLDTACKTAMADLNVEKLRQDFPLLENVDDADLPLVYLDNACMALKPKAVIAAMNEYYHSFPACGGRSIHRLSSEVTIRYEQARESIRSFLGAGDYREIVFTRNATEALNLVAHAFPWERGDGIVTSDREHNSNLVPWLYLAQKKGIVHSIVPARDNGWEFDLEAFKETLSAKTRLVSMVHTSNLDGYTLPVKAIIECAHDRGSLVMLDAAQSAPHIPLDVVELGVDFAAISLHKICGPTGIGVLWGRYELLKELLTPFIVGGDTIAKTSYNDFTLLDPPYKFEAGLQNYAGAIGAGAAADYVLAVGLENIHKHEVRLNRRLTKQLDQLEGADILGPPEAEQRGGICSFNLKGLDSHQVAMTLDEAANIMVRSGMQCVHSWFNARNLKGCTRASFYFYNTTAEVDRLTEQLVSLAETGKPAAPN